MKNIGKSKLSEMLPYLREVAFVNGLRLNRLEEFRKARVILANLYQQ